MALLCVHNDIVRGHGVCLILLDLSAVFDTVNHIILLICLREYVALERSAINLFESYLNGRTQRVSVEDVLSELNELVYDVPKGSVLSPIEFCIYTIPPGAILRHCNIKYHIYADDT